MSSPLGLGLWIIKVKKTFNNVKQVHSWYWLHQLWCYFINYKCCNILWWHFVESREVLLLDIHQQVCPWVAGPSPSIGWASTKKVRWVRDKKDVHQYLIGRLCLDSAHSKLSAVILAHYSYKKIVRIQRYDRALHLLNIVLASDLIHSEA